MAIWYRGVFAKRKKSDKTLVVDFDGTIAVDEYPSIGKPKPMAKESLKRLMDAGYEIVIFTARLRKKDGRPTGERKRQKKAIEEWLKDNEIPYTKIDEGYDGKPHCKHFIDDKNIEYRGGDDWERITDLILSKK